MSIPFSNSYARLPERFYERTRPAPASQPELLVFNSTLADELGLPSSWLKSADGVRALAGSELAPGSEPLALAYAGHQFGGFVAQLGDGRAHLLGEIVKEDGQRFDIQLKGSGPTRFSRGGDGRAALGPVLREYLISESMYALGIPTTRCLAAVKTGDPVYREKVLPGAVVTRVAASHLRVGTFEYFAARGDSEALEILVQHALDRHYPDSEDARAPAIRLLDCVIASQARLVAHWMAVGFVHGVMNTDNCTISGETIDYGPCAFLDAFDPSRCFSSIDRGGRYAYDQQPKVAHWNLARLAEALLPLLGPSEESAVSTAKELLEKFPARYEKHSTRLTMQRLGLPAPDVAVELDRKLRALMQAEAADYTDTYYRLSRTAHEHSDRAFLDGFKKHSKGAQEWLDEYRAALQRAESNSPESDSTKPRVPIYIPRNHLVEEALQSAEAGDFTPFFRLLDAVQAPFIARADAEDLATPPGPEQWTHKTFCGT